MVNKTVMSVNMQCYKCKRIALKSVTEIDGIDSIEFNMKDQTVTVVGDADPVCMANQLRRKFRCASLISHGPPPATPKPKETDKPKEEPKPKDKKDNKPKEESKNAEGSGQNPNKKPPKNPAPKEEKTTEVVPVICYPPYGYHTAYSAPPPPYCCCGYSPCSCRSEIGVYVLNEEPPSCTIC